MKCILFMLGVYCGLEEANRVLSFEQKHSTYWSHTSSAHVNIFKGYGMSAITPINVPPAHRKPPLYPSNCASD